MPILHLSQLIGVAAGLEESELKFKRHVVAPSARAREARSLSGVSSRPGVWRSGGADSGAGAGRRAGVIRAAARGGSSKRAGRGCACSPVPGLPPELDGLRIAHLSDFHLGVPSPGSGGRARRRLGRGAAARSRRGHRRPADASAGRAAAAGAGGAVAARRSRCSATTTSRSRATRSRARRTCATSSRRAAARRGRTIELRGKSVQIAGVDPRLIVRRLVAPERPVGRRRPAHPALPLPGRARPAAGPARSTSSSRATCTPARSALPCPGGACGSPTSGCELHRPASTARPGATMHVSRRARHDLRAVPLPRAAGGDRAGPTIRRGDDGGQAASVAADVLAATRPTPRARSTASRAVVGRRGGRIGHARRTVYASSSASRVDWGASIPEVGREVQRARRRLPRADGRRRARRGRRRGRRDRRRA